MSLKITAYNRKCTAFCAFLFSLLLSAIIVLPVMCFSKGYFLYYGDFNVQQIPFYVLCHDAILNGETAWSHITDLGANFVGSYTFYVLTSPFFLFTLLFNSSAVPYLFGPLLILKLSLASTTAFLYLRRYVNDSRFAVLGGLMYAFSGFSIYNIFFFHFHEAIIIFPLLLLCIDEFMENDRKGILALAVFSACVLNYYFFFGQAVFCLIYWVIKIISKAYTFKLKKFLLLAFECVLGVAMACAVLIPSVMAIEDNSRVDDFLTGYDALLYDVPQRYMHILTSLFFPPDIPAVPNFTPDSNSNWASIALFIPLFSVTFVISFLQQNKRSWLKRVIITLFVMAFVPILNSAFQAFNDCYYARWFYILTLMMVLCTTVSLDNIEKVDYERAFKWSAGLTVTLALSIGLMVKKDFDVADTKVYSFGLEQNSLRFWIYVAIAVLGLLLSFLIVKFTRQNKELFIRLVALSLCFVIVGYSEYLLFLGKSETDESDEFVINYALNYGEDIAIDDIKDVRSDFYNSMDNIGMFWGIPNIQAFHSIVPASTMEFYNTVGTTRDVASRPETELYGLRGLLSVKYLFDEIENKADFVSKDGNTLMPYFEYLDTQNGFKVYENKSYVPMGFCYDKFISVEEFKNLSRDVKHLALMKAMVLTQQQMKEYRDITFFKDGMYMSLNEQYSEDKLQNLSYPKYKDFDSITTAFEYSKESYKKDCENRALSACDSFSYTKNGFKASITNKGDDNLLFFSVPYDKGFTAFVNGKETEIEKVNIGFMAVRIEGHCKSEIEFVYKTPGLELGISISILSFAVFALYIITTLLFKKQKSKHKKTNHDFSE